jgi:signal peptidase I
MVATITPGEVLLVDRLTTGMYARGEIVVFRAPIPGYAGDPFTKRVIGLPGERLVMRSGRVFINGRYLPEPYVHYDRRPAEGTTLSITVPPDSVFVLGDHRDVSWDSREYGSIPLRLIIGRAWLGLAFPFRAQLLVAPAY